METEELISKFRTFFEEYYYSKITENIRLGKKRITIEYNDLARFDPEMAELLINEPEETLKAGELAIEDFDTKLKLRIRGEIPNSKYRIRDLRAKHLNKFITLEGTIETKTDVNVMMVAIKYECPSCGNVINVLQREDTVSEPSTCGCGRKGKFRVLDKQIMDCFTLRLQELSSSIKYGSEMKIKSILCKEDLTDTIIEEKLIEGMKIRVNGIYKEKLLVKNKKAQTQLITYIEANYIQLFEESFYDIEINQDDIKEIKEFAEQDNLINVISEGLFQGVHGYSKIKEALALQAFGGVSDYESVPPVRGDLHLLLVGDPGENKSAFCEFASNFNPKSVSVVGKSVSAVGLSGAVIKDELTGSFVLKPGAIPLANHGLCIAGNQKIMTDVGLINLRDININNKVISYNSIKTTNDTIKRVINNGKKETVIINLYSGDTIQCTPDHKILTGKGWKPVGDLTKEDYVKIPYQNGFKENKEEIEDGFLYGFSLCDVWYNTKIRENSERCIRKVMSYSSSIDNSERSQYVLSLLSKRGIKRISTNKKKESENYIDGGMRKFKPTIQYSFSDKKLHKKIKEMFEENKLPESTDSFYVGLLSGILSTDACISHKKGTSGIKHEISITITRRNKKEQTDEWNKNIQTMIQSLFHRFGILSCIRGDKIIISSLKSYNRCMMFKKYMVGKNKEKLYEVNPKTKIVSYDDLLDEEYHKWFKSIKFNTCKTVKLGLHSRIWCACRKNRVSCSLMKTLKPHWQDITDTPYKEPKKSYILNKVISVNPGTETDVYDLTISENSNFMLTGGLVHNCIIDELDKMNVEDRDILHEPMEQQKISISKANLADRKMLARESFLVSMNPKNGYFNDFDPIYNQIDLPPTLVSRFDLVFIMKKNRTKNDETRAFEKEKARTMMTRNKKESQQKLKDFHRFMRKYIAYARQNVFPKFDNNLEEEYLPEKFAGFDHSKKRVDNYGGKKDSFPITPRHLWIIKRIAEARRRMMLGERCTVEDVDYAIQKIEDSLKDIAIDTETGQIDQEWVSDGVSSKKKNLIGMFDEVMDEVQLDDGNVMVEDLIKAMEEKGFKSAEVEEFLQKKSRYGDIFFPKPHLVRRI